MSASDPLPSPSPRGAQGARHGSPPVVAGRLGTPAVLALPCALALGLFVLGVRDAADAPGLRWSFLGAAAALLVGTAIVMALAVAQRRTLTLVLVARKQHYVQAGAQAAVLLYWGWYWPPVYEAGSMLAAQLLFAYAFDMLLGWSRRDNHALGFGPVPVVFSINLFLWFRPEWFGLQFLMVACGFLAKELIRWERDGRHTHIFNPSSFPLALFAVALILTGTSDLTRGEDIAITQFYPPYIYLLLFLVGLPGQFLFGVTTMTMSAVVTTYVFGLVYVAATGTYFFYDSYIPIAVFLGMHLLFTDPSTSPRTELGRILFGVLYGLSAVALYQGLGALGVPTFYDKLLQVPLLNLSVRGIDRLARSGALRFVDPARLAPALSPPRRYAAYVAVWVVLFAAMSAAQGVGDSHRGQWVPYWQAACEGGSARGCAYLDGLHAIYCDAGSGWACNEAALTHASGVRTPAGGARLEPVDIAELFERGCALGFDAACHNHAALIAGQPAERHAPPELDDLPIVLRGSKAPITDRSPAFLYARACEQGWPGACDRTTPNMSSR